MNTNNDDLNEKQCDCGKDKLINDLLKRISNLEFEVEDKDRENERLNNIINNTAVELEILLQSEDFELITMQLRNIVFRLKGSNNNE